MKRIKVLLADDNRVVRKCFRKILELEDDLEVVGEAKDGHQAVAMAKKLRPALVLMDVTMPLLNGIQATGQILKFRPATKVLFLSAHTDEAYIVEAVKSGGMGYLIKQTSAGQFPTPSGKSTKGIHFSAHPFLNIFANGIRNSGGGQSLQNDWNESALGLAGFSAGTRKPDRPIASSQT